MCISWPIELDSNERHQKARNSPSAYIHWANMVTLHHSSTAAYVVTMQTQWTSNRTTLPQTPHHTTPRTTHHTPHTTHHTPHTTHPALFSFFVFFSLFSFSPILSVVRRWARGCSNKPCATEGGDRRFAYLSDRLHKKWRKLAGIQSLLSNIVLFRFSSFSSFYSPYSLSLPSFPWCCAGRAPPQET